MGEDLRARGGAWGTRAGGGRGSGGARGEGAGGGRVRWAGTLGGGVPHRGVPPPSPCAASHELPLHPPRLGRGWAGRRGEAHANPLDPPPSTPGLASPMQVPKNPTMAILRRLLGRGRGRGRGVDVCMQASGVGPTPARGRSRGCQIAPSRALHERTDPLLPTRCACAASQVPGRLGRCRPPPPQPPHPPCNPACTRLPTKTSRRRVKAGSHSGTMTGATYACFWDCFGDMLCSSRSGDGGVSDRGLGQD